MFSPFLLPHHLAFFEEDVALVKSVQVCELDLASKGGTAVLEVHGHL